MARSRLWLLVALPPILAYLITSALTVDWLALPRLVGILYHAIQDAYPLTYQAGPPHRVLVDFLLVSPVVVILGLAMSVDVVSWWKSWQQAMRATVLILVGVLLLFGLASSKNLRYAIVADPLFRLLAAVWLVEKIESSRVRWAIVAGSGVTELVLFWVIFEVGGVYDPVTANLIHALRMGP